MPLPPDTVTVAVCGPAESPVVGVTVKVPVPPTAIPEDIEAVLFRAKSLLFALTVNAPVCWVPVFVTITLNAPCGA